MKRKLLYLLVFVMTSLVFAACSDDDDDKFDETLLFGKWQTSSTGGILYYKYLSDHTGSSWDTGEDISESEAQTFNWSLDGSELKHDHDFEMRGVPKYYTVTELTSETLKYTDNIGNRKYSFTKVK
ncbi:hypothetical protein LJB94_01410 [Odoribacter sp. OttesenSCG-928-G04]|nr:hypothetical protein [Odoribacter sp. OttesenSCG-928-G04]MDL2330511.1 hypothetical protein [Odoribacter sp. OttesenSCG-928-A06]